MQSVNSHPSFRFLRTQKIHSLNVDVQEFEHIVTGAKHYHIAAERDENVFLVAFRTVPEDSTGVAHILEHTALCGSERYPVRDPFFMMTRRSLNTFMNAFTSSDWTAYPFASQNRKDFFNLLDVYLDAAFFSRLDPLDFAQEGHRVEFAEAGNADSELVYKGVVFNEMKGAMSSPVSTLWQTLTRYLFPTTTYHHNSGGEPSCIPDLSYEELLEFYRSHYHPSNAVFMTFGDIEAVELQGRFEDLALSRFERSDHEILVEDEKRYFAPIRVEEAYALDQEDLDNQTHHVLGWLLPKSIDLDELMRAHLLSRVLLDNSSSPLRAALESSDLGSAPSPLCGLEDSNREMSFMCGLEGSNPEQAAEFERLVIDTLEQVAKDGVPQEMVEAQLHQLELSQREITGDSYPFGLQLILGALSSGVHRGDPLAALNVDAALEKLREAIKDPDYIPSLVRRWLLDNPHRVRLTLRPDNQLASLRDAAEAARLAEIKAAMSDEEKNAVIELAAKLEARQMQSDDESILPRVTLEDVPTEMHLPKGESMSLPRLDGTWYSAGTNGLVYQQVIMDLPKLSEDELELMPLYTHCLTELGCGERDYRQNQAYQSQITGGFSAYTTVRGRPENEQDVTGYLVLSGKALVVNRDALADLMVETLDRARFDETKRLREIVSQMRSRREQSITGQGHSMAMLAACAGFAPSAQLAHNSRGLEGVRRVKAMDRSLEDAAALAQLSERLQRIHERMKGAPRRFLTVGEEEYKASLSQAVEMRWASVPVSDSFEPFSLPQTRQGVSQAWLTSTQVSFCAKAFPTVTVDHADAAPLTVLGEFLRNNYLHRAIREQGGAYGAGASQDSGDAVFRFFSYRDPRITGTLDDFDAAARWINESDIDPLKLEEAILGVVSSIDKPGSPAGEAKQTYHASLFGRTPEQRQKFRSEVLSVGIADLKRVAELYLKPEKASVAVVTSAKGAAALPDSFERIEI
ncbi:metalloprotease, insulinase family [Marinobacterium lacunae]|uniref:Metalloprotease, insulinase family n=1 Tax=Marinobacterium lacunae TaxID=1232683 RepID=A0A081FZD8_9GAMM|nr:insulinase family protein [Marinobacterium lacunae]KEA63893.1 metalloprotease, insulinase family [Marinobacterium lacunae]